MFNYPIKEFDDTKNLMILDHDAGEFIVKILRCEITEDWDTQTFLCEITEPFMLFEDEQTYVVFQTSLNGIINSSNSYLFDKNESKKANQFYIERISRLNVK